jgi:hypothetical protein
MIAAPLRIGIEEYVEVVVVRQYRSGNKKLYAHEVTIKEKLLDGSSNPALIPATNQGVISDSLTGSSNPTQSLAAYQGDIAKVLNKIISAKSD